MRDRDQCLRQLDQLRHVPHGSGLRSDGPLHPQLCRAGPMPARHVWLSPQPLWRPADRLPALHRRHHLQRHNQHVRVSASHVRPGADVWHRDQRLWQHRKLRRMRRRCSLPIERHVRVPSPDMRAGTDLRYGFQRLRHRRLRYLPRRLGVRWDDVQDVRDLRVPGSHLRHRAGWMRKYPQLWRMPRRTNLWFKPEQSRRHALHLPAATVCPRPELRDGDQCVRRFSKLRHVYAAVHLRRGRHARRLLGRRKSVRLCGGHHRHMFE